MIYMTTPCEKNAAIICQEFAIPRSLENYKDETDPWNQVGQHIPLDPLRQWHFTAKDLPKGHADSVRMRVADRVRTWIGPLPPWTPLDTSVLRVAMRSLDRASIPSGRYICAALALQPNSKTSTCKIEVQWFEDDQVTKTWMGDDIRDNSLWEESNDYLQKICHSRAPKKLRGQNKPPKLVPESHPRLYIGQWLGPHLPWTPLLIPSMHDLCKQSTQHINQKQGWDHLELLLFSPNYRQTRPKIERGST